MHLSTIITPLCEGLRARRRGSHCPQPRGKKHHLKLLLLDLHGHPHGCFRPYFAARSGASRSVVNADERRGSEHCKEVMDTSHSRVAFVAWVGSRGDGNARHGLFAEWRV